MNGRPWPTLGVCACILAVTGCDGLQRYLDEHQAKQHQQSFSYRQNGRVEFYGPFDMAILQQNQAFPMTPEDAKNIQESFAVVIAQPIVVDGRMMIPPVPQTKRTVHIAHFVRGFADQEPAPAWAGPVIHESTTVPWSGDEQARYENQWRYEHHTQHTTNDRPEGRTPADAPVGGVKP